MKKENFKDGISFNYIYIPISSGLSVGLSACTGEMERKSLACIQLDFLLSAKWKIAGLSFGDNASDPLYWHLADFAQNRRSKSRGRHGSETKESN